MNNAQLSIVVTSADATTEPRPRGHSSSWDCSPEDLLQDKNSLAEESDSDGSVMIERADETFIYNQSFLQTLYVQFRSEVKRVDTGLWLLCSSAIRQNEWKYLREVIPKAVALHGASARRSQTLKRICDILGSLVFLVVSFPLFVLVAILIKLDSPGPVFFRHSRVGRAGEEFILWKFRSMKMDVPKYAVSPQSATDPRLTRIGRVLRRFSLDEVPQLINVLKGEMSLVGPRPEMPFVVESYRSADYERFAVRPGITGLWQISPARAFPIHENLQYDLYYIRNQNVLLDCAIILRTITAVIHGIGAI